MAVFNSAGVVDHYEHTDWLGSTRLATAPNRTVVWDGSYAPFGESYNEYPSANIVYHAFTGQREDTAQGLDDFMFREYSAAQQGRWISPDPAGLAAVDITNPQTWNRYAYVGNTPLNTTDPLGLHYYDCSWFGGCSGWANGNNGYYGGGGAACSLDGISTNCALIPTGDSLGANGITPVITGNNGQVYEIDAGGAWMNFSTGEELSAADFEELPYDFPQGGDPFDGPSGGGGGSGMDCTGKILGGLHQVLGNFNTQVNKVFDAGVGTATNLRITATDLSPTQFNAIQPGARWSLSPGFVGGFLGLGQSLHIASPSSLWDASFAFFNNDNVGGQLSATFTVHIDNGNPNRPLGLFEHFFVDILSRHRPKC